MRLVRYCFFCQDIVGYRCYVIYEVFFFKELNLNLIKFYLYLINKYVDFFFYFSNFGCLVIFVKFKLQFFSDICLLFENVYYYLLLEK